MKELFENTFYRIAFEPTPRYGILTHLVCWTINTVIRLGMLYATVYTVASAWKAT